MARTRVLPCLSVLTAAAVLVVVDAVRFGDRLTPRLPTPYSSSVPSHSIADNEYENHFNDEDQYSTSKSHQINEDLLSELDSSLRRPTRTEAHRLEMSTEYFVIPEKKIASIPSTTTVLMINVETTTLKSSSDVTQLFIPPVVGVLKQESWAVPVLALACVCMVSIGAFEAFVVWGASRTAPSRRHLLLGQCLLFGLFMCAATAALYTSTPNAFICGSVRFCTGVAYVIVFASLLVKCVFLLSLNGGVYLPAAYQGLLLFFAVMIQVAIGAQWLGGTPPRVASDGVRCESGLSDMLTSLCYAAFLIVVVCGVALRSRGIRDNYREATYIASAGGATAAVWVCWVAAALGAPEGHRDACLAAGLLATCAVVFALMFAPKGRRLAALGREGRWDADRDEGLSSLGAGAGGSGYSPSFFHFKPVKYGMVSASAIPPQPLDHKEPPAQPADPYRAHFGPPHKHTHPLYPPPPTHYPMHPLMHYHFNYPYQYLLPPGVMLRPDDGNVYTSAEPTFSSNPNVFFQRTEPLHVGMMY